MRKIILLVLFLILLLSGCKKDNINLTDISASPEVSQEFLASPSTQLIEFKRADTERIKTDILEIAKVCRSAGSEEERNAALYIMKQLEAAGYAPVMQEYYFESKEEKDESGVMSLAYIRVEPTESYDIKTQNVCAVRTASNGNMAPIIILSAHYDSFMGVGALDNASGTAALLELSRLITNTGNYEIRFVFFGAEEWFLRGSQNYVKDLSDEEKSRIIANINMDTIGYNGFAKLNLYIWDHTGSKAVDLLTASKAWSDIEITESKDYKSDHTSFAEEGIPAVLMIDKPTDTNLSKIINSEEDTLEKVDAHRIKEIVDMVISSLAERMY